MGPNDGMGYPGYPKRIGDDKWEFKGELRDYKAGIPFVYTQTVGKYGDSLKFNYTIEPKGEVELNQFCLYMRLPIASDVTFPCGNPT